MVVAEVDSPERWAFGLKVGAQVGLTDTASGYVLLAFQDEAGRRAMMASHQKVEGELDVNRTQLLKVVRNVARKGYAQIQSRQIEASPTSPLQFLTVRETPWRCSTFPT
jgi:DNA-binding IclR family transcriptional regulator